VKALAEAQEERLIVALIEDDMVSLIRSFLIDPKLIPPLDPRLGTLFGFFNKIFGKTLSIVIAVTFCNDLIAPCQQGLEGDPPLTPLKQLAALSGTQLRHAASKFFLSGLARPAWPPAVCWRFPIKEHDEDPSLQACAPCRSNFFRRINQLPGSGQ
jgi:hypothetical protein